MNEQFSYRKKFKQKVRSGYVSWEKIFKQLKKAFAPIRWQDENLSHDREDASDMLKYLNRICVEFEQT